MLPLLFIDFETTGLDPFVDEIIEVAYIQLTQEDAMRKRFDRSDIKCIPVMPLTPQRAFLKVNGVSASDINGFNIEAWEKRDPFRWIDANNFIYSWIKESRWVGCNPTFDYQFYTTLCERHHIRPANPGTHHLLDISSMAHTLYTKEKISDVRLDNLASHYGLSRKNKHHSAVDDVYLTAQIYRQLCF